jgi:hypothetical protein
MYSKAIPNQYKIVFCITEEKQSLSILEGKSLNEQFYLPNEFKKKTHGINTQLPQSNKNQTIGL